MSQKAMAGISLTGSNIMVAPSDATSEGDTAASVFERFDQGVSPDEVVTELVLAVETVECLWRTWARLRRVVSMSPETVRALREALSSHQPLGVAAEVVEAVRRFVERTPKLCTRCKVRCQEYCTSCPAKEAHRARKPRGRRAASRTGL